MTGLTSGARQEFFCREYLVDNNGRQAAIRAGYSAKTADSQASRLLTNVKVRARIEELRAERITRLEIRADMVVRELAKIAFATMSKFVSIDSAGQPIIDLRATPQNDMDALAEVSTETVLERNGSYENAPPPDRVRKTKIKLHDKLGALKLLAGHTGVFAERDKRQATDLAAAFSELMSRNNRAPIQTGRQTLSDFDDDEVDALPPLQ